MSFWSTTGTENIYSGTGYTTQTPTTPTIPESCGTAVGAGGNAKTGKYKYGESPRCMSIVQNGLTCSMENDYVLTVDLKQTEDESKRDVITFPSCCPLWR